MADIGGTSVSFSPDGRHLATVFSAQMKVWDGRPNLGTLTLEWHTTPVTGVGFSADGRRIIAQAGEVVKAWDTTTGAAVEPCPDPPPPPDQRLAHSPDGKMTAWANGTRVQVIRAEEWQRQLEVDDEIGREWHLRQAAESEKASDWFAAAFHLKLAPGRAGERRLPQTTRPCTGRTAARERTVSHQAARDRRATPARWHDVRCGTEVMAFQQLAASDRGGRSSIRQGRRLLQRSPHLVLRHVVEQRHLAHAPRQHEPQTARHVLLVAPHHRKQILDRPALRRHRQAEPPAAAAPAAPSRRRRSARAARPAGWRRPCRPRPPRRAATRRSRRPSRRRGRSVWP